MSLTLWWHGSPYLTLLEHQWLSGDFKSLEERIPEQRATCAVVATSDFSVINELINKYSDLNKACRILTYCFRFFAPNSFKPSALNISPQEISHSMNLLCRTIQKQAFPGEYNPPLPPLSQSGSISSSSKLNSLAPFMSDDALIRVGGRLRHSSLTFDACH